MSNPLAQMADQQEQANYFAQIWARTKTRRFLDVPEGDLSHWAKTFHIMLTNQKIPFADLKLVVDALADHRLELDYGRYNQPFDLHRNGEWPYVLAAVQIAMMRQEQFPTPPPTPTPDWWDGEGEGSDEDDDEWRNW